MRRLVLAGLAVLALGAGAAIALAAGANPQFTFSADEPGAAFQCSLDGAAFKTCSSPQNYTGLTPGSHTVDMQATFQVPKPASPVASFTTSPSNPSTGQQVTFTATDTTADCPCTYSWAGDGGSNGQSPNQYPLGTGNPFSFTFSDTGTKYVRLTVTGTDGQTTALEQDLEVSAVRTTTTSTTSTTSTTTSTTPPPPSQTTDCFASPSSCGYPDATNTGVPAGTSLTPMTGDITASTPGQTISNVDLSGGRINVTANNVTIKNSRITGCDNSGFGIYQNVGVTGLVVQDTTIQGSNNTNCALSAGIQANGGYSATRLHCLNLDTCFHEGYGTIKDSYAYDNAQFDSEHYEPAYIDGEAPNAVTYDHNTLINVNVQPTPAGEYSHNQTAVIFQTDYNGNVGPVTITNNLLAGGGYMLYGGTGWTNNVLGPMKITGNRFARCLATSASCPDSHGEWPSGGYWGPFTSLDSSVTTWSGNFWDDNLAPISGP